jgi:hypothetical protein
MLLALIAIKKDRSTAMTPTGVITRQEGRSRCQKRHGFAAASIGHDHLRTTCAQDAIRYLCHRNPPKSVNQVGEGQRPHRRSAKGRGKGEDRTKGNYQTHHLDAKKLE